MVPKPEQDVTNQVYISLVFNKADILHPLFDTDLQTLNHCSMEFKETT